MAKKLEDEKSASEMKKIIWAKVHELQEARKRAFEAHKENRARMLPFMSEIVRELSEGCAEAANIADQIKYLIETGKMLGLIQKELNYWDYL